MKKLIFLFLIPLFFSGCFGARFFSKPPPHKTNPSPVVKTISFEEVDVNNDGNISRQEVEIYNKAEQRHSSDINLAKPLIYSAILLALILLICGHKKIIKFFSSLFPKK